MIILIYIVFIAVISYWQVKLVMVGKITKGRAICLYLVYAILPVILYGMTFLALVGIEELIDVAIIGEGYARTLPFVIVTGLAMALMCTLIFSFAAIFIKQRNVNPT